MGFGKQSDAAEEDNSEESSSNPQPEVSDSKEVKVKSVSSLSVTDPCSGAVINSQEPVSVPDSAWLQAKLKSGDLVKA